MMWRLGSGQGRRASVIAALSVVMMLLFGQFAHAVPSAAAPDRVPVLIIDGGLGDDRFYGTHWLGEVEVVAAEGGARLVTSAAPTWWGGTGAPDTYVLSGSDGSGAPASKSIGVAEIAWAIDQVVARNPVGRVVLVAQGAAGLQARRYVCDLGDPLQSSRADVVGLVLLGVPNQGVSYQVAYPDLDVWSPYAAGAGLAPEQLIPGSPLLAELDAARMPAVVKTLVVQGLSVKLDESDSDGVLTVADSALTSGTAAGPVDTVTVRARASESWSLRDTWYPKTKKGGALAGALDEQPVESLGPLSGYATSPETRQVVRTYYETWFSGAVPATHLSTRLVVDVSGSMTEALGSGTRLDAAKRAMTDFMDAAGSRAALSWSVPEDFGLIAFNESIVEVVAPGSDVGAVKTGVEGLVASKNTNIGAALEAAIASFDGTPKVADSVIILLSDGLSTRGMSNQEILDGPVKAAAARGIRIETILLGADVDSPGQQFLTQVAQATGGTFHNSRSLHELRRDFLRARFVGLGEMFVDSAVAPEAQGVVDLGTVAPGTRLLEFAVLTDAGVPTFTLLRDGQEVAPESVVAGVSVEGLATGTILAPEPGTYTLRVGAEGASATHVFVSRQVDAFRSTAQVAIEDNTGMMLLVGIGALAFIGVGGTIAGSVVARRRKGRVLESDFGEALGQESGDRVDE